MQAGAMATVDVWRVDLEISSESIERYRALLADDELSGRFQFTLAFEDVRGLRAGAFPCQAGPRPRAWSSARALPDRSTAPPLLESRRARGARKPHPAGNAISTWLCVGPIDHACP